MSMKVELFYIADCPNYETARQFLTEALRGLGLSGKVSEIEVRDCEQAEALMFPGSPTIRVDGKDVELTLLEQDHYGLSCRIYLVDQQRQGFPSREMIRDAIRSSISADAKRSE